jgi:hydroxymethylpyrimidine pyrophosphatase-like HAD family hydrolase
VERIVNKHRLTTVWNGEAYDVLISNLQSKALGLKYAMKIFKLSRKNVLAIGDNYNDLELLKASGLPISSDKTRVQGKFYIPLNGKLLPADKLMQKILSLRR